MRLRRKRKVVRAFRKSYELHPVQNNTARIGKSDIILACTFRNEKNRLPYFLQYYRNLGVDHFLFIDNDSSDGAQTYLSGMDDVSIWHTCGSYKRASFGMDWVNYLLYKYGHDHWALVVDPDEFFIYPFCDTRPLRALTDWLHASDIPSFSAMLLDMYGKGKLDASLYQAGQDPLEVTPWFDSGNYTFKHNHEYGNLWIQGGPRARVFFKDRPNKAPALNKIPLVRWKRGYAYVSSVHAILPRVLNKVYDSVGGEKASGLLLHTKFLDTFGTKAAEELARGEHYANSQEYIAYSQQIDDHPELWCKWSERYINWRQLEVLGLMSKGDWT